MIGDLGGLGGLSIGGRIISVGIDVVAIDRFVESLQRTPGIRNRLFAPAELISAGGAVRSGASLAARFAVKEAIAKALGVPPGMRWHDASVVSLPSGRPTLQVTGTVAAFAASVGITGWQLSISHDGGIAAAIVLAMGEA